MYTIRHIFLFIILMGGTLGILYFIVNPEFHWLLRLIIPIIIFIILILSLKYLDYIRCDKCNSKCYSTGTGGSKYKQYFCSKCIKTLWVDFSGKRH